MSYQSYTGTPIEEWQDFVLWDDDCYNNPTANRGNNHHGYLGVGVSGIESPYVTSAPPSNYDGPSSFDYNVSAPPSVVGESSSYGQFYGTSPTFSSTATSPLVGRDELRFFGSFGACDNFLSPLREATESPLIDTTRERIVDSTSSLATTAGQVFNPHLADSYQAFSGRDMVASQILTSNTGTWAETSWVSEPIAEGDENGALTSTAPIPIIRTQTQSLNGSFDSYNQSRNSCDNRTRAITIPQPNGKPTSYSAGASRSRWVPNVPPMLSTSPVSQRRPRSCTLSRSNSRAEYRKSRASPPPTSAHSLGWVSMQMDSQSGRMAAATSFEGTQGRIAKGRKKGLDPRQRSEAALMRIIGSCSNCKKRKEKCDPGTPCKSCLKHYKGDLVNNPCRNHLLADLTKAFLSNRHGWHPTARSLESSIAPHGFSILTDITYTIPLYFGFGQPISVSVHPIELDSTQPLIHEHLVYSWPPQSSTISTHIEAVLPAVLTANAVMELKQNLDAHLTRLIMTEFSAFPLYCSQLRALRSVYIFFRSFRSDSKHSHTLLQALKLLVLVHIGGDITLPKRTESRFLARLIHDTMNVSSEYRPTPCFIRSQFGGIMPNLAHELMKSVLSSLELLLLGRNEGEWSVTLATLIVVLMTVESIHYHSAKRPYHEAHKPASSAAPIDHVEGDDEAVNKLLKFYSACFSACHTRLRPDWEGEPDRAAVRASTSDTFIKSIREAVGKASPGGYLLKKAHEKRTDDEDMGFFFDRLVARLLLLDPQP
ncbi:hypothetical protein BU25DRAFT_455942 [Macroventuria anomochaeta]|uniref:Uncharacterized protein n=1 Tax=Macroventuria anomochaeta TaxID=301207 RepID=A0ACB6SA86_9PLEO|nr:uncharacterized protein BU25DRAFT_455942 [Macroventuria anomochaeta]KAF2630887.1 hypothetical protein BU25DRAFT_455942 [Macroventuria anomochaeta]